MKRKNDIILVAAVLLIAAAVLLFLFMAKDEGAYVRVTVNGELKGEYPLDKNMELRIGEEDSYNTLSITDGKASVIDADCPDKLCVHQGKIHLDGQSIICLPNKLVVEVVGGEKSDFDAVVK